MFNNIHKTLQPNEIKVLRDPVHEYIHITSPIIWNLIDTDGFQRLRRIHQLGGTYQVYHGGEHSRFSHSLGVYEITRRMIEEVKGLKESLNEHEQLALLCAALLHDVGHGPFSHAFESVTSTHHEELTLRIILEDTQINSVLKRVDPSFPQTIADIIGHKHPRKLLTQVMSSQLDADRMDYLLRDSYFTGVSYGSFDLERILRTLRVVDDKLVIKESGIHAVEDYIMARYQMYWQVYFHPTSRAFEIMMEKMFLALKQLYLKDPQFVIENTPELIGIVDETKFTIQDYLQLDEFSVVHCFKVLTGQDKYPYIKELGLRLLNRNLFEYQTYSKQQEERIKNNLINLGYPIDLFYGDDTITQQAYKTNELYKNESKDAILVLLSNGELEEISQHSSVVSAMSQSKAKSEQTIFTIKEAIK